MEHTPVGILQDGSLVVLGAVVALGPSWLNERLRHRQATRDYWRDQCRGTYTTFLGHCSRLENDTVRIGRLVRALQGGGQSCLPPESLRHPELIPDPALSAAVAERNASAELMTDAYETLRLIGSPAVVDAARDLMTASNELLDLARRGRFEADDRWHSDRRSLSEGRQALRQAARRELGLVEG